MSLSISVLDGLLDGDIARSSEVAHDTPCIASLTYEQCCYQCCGLNIAQRLLIVLTHMAIQVVYSHYVLTPSMECLWYVKFDILVLSKKISQ